MKEPNLLARIDEYYTKAVKVIIGDLPLTQLKPENYDTSTTKENIAQIQHIYNSLKADFLALGTPENEKELLYSEVKKRDMKPDDDDNLISKENIDQAKDIYNSLKSGFLTLGTPDNEKELRYEEVLKKEKAEAKEPVTMISTKATKKKAIKQETKTKNTAAGNKVKKSSAAPRGAKKAAKIALYIKDIKKHYGEVDEDFLAIIVKNLGPSIYKKDAELVSCSEQKELDTVRKNFLIKKLGLNASNGVLDAAIKDVCEELESTRTKYRATFYYRLAKKFKKESALS